MVKLFKVLAILVAVPVVLVSLNHVMCAVEKMERTKAVRIPADAQTLNGLPVIQVDTNNNPMGQGEAMQTGKMAMTEKKAAPMKKKMREGKTCSKRK